MNNNPIPTFFPITTSGGLPMLLSPLMSPQVSVITGNPFALLGVALAISHCSPISNSSTALNIKDKIALRSCLNYKFKILMTQINEQ